MQATIKIPDKYKERILEAFRTSQFDPPSGLSNIQLFEFVLARLITRHVRQSEMKVVKNTIVVPDDFLTVIDIQSVPPQ